MDALFDEFGEVVRSDNDSVNVTSEVDEDSDSLACKYSGTLFDFPFPLCFFHQGFCAGRGYIPPIWYVKWLNNIQ